MEPKEMLIKATFVGPRGLEYSGYTESGTEQEISEGLKTLQGATLRQTSVFMGFPNLYAADHSFESDAPIFVNVSDIHFLTYSMEEV